MPSSTMGVVFERGSHVAQVGQVLAEVQDDLELLMLLPYFWRGGVTHLCAIAKGLEGDQGLSLRPSVY